jgi:hypothetical protein
MDAPSCFADSYAGARAKFLDAARAAGARLDAIQHPLRGPDAEKLFADMAWLGAADARRVLVTISATHGVEGFCGSGCQVATFADGIRPPAGVAIMAIHAINPHGFAWLRRVTEDNVDLNRNFLDHSQPYPVNEGYEELADAIVPSEWNDTTRAASAARLDAYRRAHGPVGLHSALGGGQYSHPDGIFFGGHARTWSNRTLSRLYGELLRARRAIAIIDYHTGLGPFGHGELIAPYPPDTRAFAASKAVFGDDLTSPEQGSSSSPPLNGINLNGLRRLIGEPDWLAAAALEYGTYSPDEVMEALRADNWLHWRGDLASPQAKTIKAAMRRAFYPDGDEWRRMVWTRAAEVTRRFLDALAKT